MAAGGGRPGARPGFFSFLPGRASPLRFDMPKSYDHRFGLDWPTNVPDHQKHLLCARFHKLEPYASSMVGNPEDHMARAVEMLFDPSDFKMNDWAAKIMWAWCHYDMITIMGPAAANKSHSCALLALLDWIVLPRHTSTFFASTTKAALERRSWNSVLQFFQLLRKRGGPGVISKSRTAIINEDDARQDGHKGYDVKSGLFGIAVLAGTLQDALSNIIGVHQPYFPAAGADGFGECGGVRMFADEAQAIRQAFIDARFNLMMGTPDFRIVLLGNPMSFEDPLGELAKPIGGWEAVTIEDDQWETQAGGVNIHFDGERSPALADPIGFPFLINQSQMNRVLLANLGNRSATDYLTMCRGWISQESDINVVLPRSMLSKFQMEEQPIWEGEFEVVAGLDPAFSAGGDRAVLQIAYVGFVKEGGLIIGFGPTHYLVILGDSDTPVSYQVSEQVRQLGMGYGLHPKNLACDETGTQRISDVIEMEWDTGILRKAFNARASDLPVSIYNDKPCKEYYHNCVTELWYTLQQFGQFGQIRALPKQAAKEFAMRRIDPDKRPRRLESKVDMKKRLKHSPDTADACALCLAVARERIGVNPGSSRKSPGGAVVEQFAPEDIAKFNNLVRSAEYSETYESASGGDYAGYDFS